MPAQAVKSQWPSKVLVGLQDTVADMIAERDPQSVLQKAAQRTAELVGADIVTLHIYEPATGRVLAAAGIGLWDQETFRQHVAGRGKVALRVVERNAPIIAEEISTSELAGPFADREQVRSAAGFPLKVRDQAIGVLFVSYRQPHRFTTEEVETLTSFGHLAAIAIDSARLYEQAQVKASAIREISEVGQSLLVVRDVKPLLERIVKAASEVLRADVVVLYEYMSDIDDIRVPPVMWGNLRHPEVLQAVSSVKPHRESAVFRMLERAEPFYAANAAADWAQVVEGWAPRGGGLGDFVYREEIASSAAVPLIAEDVPVAVLFANYRTPRAFPGEERSIIELFAVQAAIAIQNARLLERESRLRQQADTLREVSAAISSVHELGELAVKILDELGKVVEYRKASLQLIHGEERELIGFRGFGPEAIDQWLLRPISQDRLISRIVTSREPCILSHLPLDGQEDWEVRPETESIKSWAGVPVVYRGEVIGLLTLDHDVPGFYAPGLKALLVAFANQAATAIQNARLLQRRIRDLEMINTVGQVISTKLDYRNLLQTIVSQIAEKLNCSHCTLFFPAKVNGETFLVPEVTHGSRAEVLTRHFKLEEGLLGWVYRHGESVVLADARLDPRFAPARQRQEQPRSMLVVPVKVGSRTVGVISADQDKQGWFAESERRLAEALAQQAGIAIERAVGLGLLQKIGNRIIGVRQVDEILQEVVSGAMEMTHTTSGVIYLISPDGRSVTRSFQYPPDFDHPKPRLDTGKGITRQVVETGEMMLFPDVQHDGRVNHVLRKRGIRSMIAVPLKLGREVTGVLYLNDMALHEFTETELSLLSTLANQAAIAIQNVRVFDELTLLHEVGAQLMTLNLDDLLLFIVQGAMRLTDTEYGFVNLWSADGTAITHSVSLPAGTPHPHSHTSETGLSRLIFETGQPVFIADATRDARVNPDIRKMGIKSFIGQPLKVADQVIGVLFLNDTSRRQFSESQRSLISALADQAAVAIYNARLFENSDRLSRGHETLNLVGSRLLGVLDEKEILKQVARAAADTLQCTQSTVFLVKGDQLVVETSQGDRNWSFQEGRTFKVGQGVAGRVAQAGKPRLVTQAANDPAFSPGWSEPEADPESLVVVPILLDGRVYGVISVEHNRTHAFDDQDQRLLETLASQVSQAVRNARLFETRQRLETQLQSLHQVVQEQSLDRVLERIVEGIADILGEGTSPTINLYSEETGKFSRCHACGPLRQELQVPPRQRGGTGKYVIKTGEPLYLDDVLHPPPDSPTVRSTSIDRLGIRSFAAIPLKRQQQIVGVLFVNVQRSLSFSSEIRRVLELFAGQAAIAIHVSQNLERNIRELEALTEIGRTVSNLGIDQILDLIYEQAAKIMDLSDAQVQIAFYDQKQDQIRFPLAVEQDNGVIIDRVRWGVREAAYRGSGAEDEMVVQFQPRPRGTRYGLTEYVIHKAKPVLIVKDFQQKTKRLGLQVWPTFGLLDRPTHSWLGVPMIVQNQVVGIISIQSLEQEHAFDEGHQELLCTVANQAAVAIENARLYDEQRNTIQALEEAQEKIAQLERVRTMSNMAADFVHRINNMAGTIPIRLQRIQETLADYPEAKSVLKPFLKGIEADTKELLTASARLKDSTRKKTRYELVDVQALIASLVREARLKTPLTVNISDRQLTEEVPPVRGVRSELEDAFRDVITNAVEAMASKGGQLDISTAHDRTGRGWVEIVVRDEGYGIAKEKLPDVFGLFYTTKGTGLGYGLWRTRNSIEAFGGEITLDSEVGHGTAVTIRLPAAKAKGEPAK